MLTSFIKSVIENDRHLMQDLSVGESLVGAYYVEVGDYLVDQLGWWNLRWGRIGGADVVGALVMGDVGVGTRGFSRSGVIPGASYFMADETFVVSKVLCTLNQG